MTSPSPTREGARRRIVLAVTSDLSIVFVSGVAGFLADRAWDVHVVCSPGPNSEALDQAHPAITVHHVEMPREPAPLRDLRSLAVMVGLLRKLRPHVVSAATPKAGLVVGLASAFTRVPVRIYQLWGLRYETTSGPARRVFKALEKAAVRASTHVLANSSSMRTVAIADGLVRPQDVEVLGSGSSHGVDVDRFNWDTEQRFHARQERWGDTDDAPVVGFVGRVHPDKGIDTLMSALRILSRRGVTGRLLLVGAAEGAEHLVRGEISGWEIDSTGHVTDVAPYLQLMDVLCLPSRREGFPNAVLEAAAAGVPCVTTPATGSVDAVVDGVTGVVAASHNPSDVADGLERLITDPILRARMGQAARQRAQSEFAQELVWDAYATFYERAANA